MGVEKTERIKAEVIDFKPHVAHKGNSALLDQLQNSNAPVNPLLLMVVVASQYMDDTEKHAMDSALNGIEVELDQFNQQVAAQKELASQLTTVVNSSADSVDGNLDKFQQELTIQNQLMSVRNDLGVKQNRLNLDWSQQVDPIQKMIEQEGNMCAFMIKTKIETDTHSK